MGSHRVWSHPHDRSVHPPAVGSDTSSAPVANCDQSLHTMLHPVVLESDMSSVRMVTHYGFHMFHQPEPRHSGAVLVGSPPGHRHYGLCYSPLAVGTVLVQSD